MASIRTEKKNAKPNSFNSRVLEIISDPNEPAKMSAAVEEVPALYPLVMETREKSGTRASRSIGQRMIISRLCLVMTLARLSKNKQNCGRRTLAPIKASEKTYALSLCYGRALLVRRLKGGLDFLQVLDRIDEPPVAVVWVRKEFAVRY